MAIVTVKNKYQVVIPQSVRDQMEVNVGDLLDAKVEKGKITFTPKSVVDRAIAEGLADVEAGRVSGPFDNVEDMLASLKGKKRKTAARPKPRPR
jgi:AbrB family looped-hinge helix DNA binding protein